MFNLLPPSLKEKIIKEYGFRRLIVVFLFILFIQISFLIFLFPTWVMSYYKNKEMISQTEGMNRSIITANTNSINAEIKSINFKLNTIKGTLEYPEFIPLVNNILSKKTESIRITDITYSSTKATEATMSLRGVSLNRESLVIFFKSLSSTPGFKKVELPISNFTKDKNISFSINITVAL